MSEHLQRFWHDEYRQQPVLTQMKGSTPLGIFIHSTGVWRVDIQNASTLWPARLSCHNTNMCKWPFFLSASSLLGKSWRKTAQIPLSTFPWGRADPGERRAGYSAVWAEKGGFHNHLLTRKYILRSEQRWNIIPHCVARKPLFPQDNWGR